MHVATSVIVSVYAVTATAVGANWLCHVDLVLSETSRVRDPEVVSPTAKPGAFSFGRQRHWWGLC